MSQSPNAKQRAAQERGALWSRLALVLFVAACAQLISMASSHLQAGSAAFQLGENFWSKSRQRAVAALFDYSLHGNPRSLALARIELDVPLGDLAARHALDRRPFDDEARREAREGLRRGRIPESVISRVIRMYHWLGREPRVARALDAWRKTDADLLRLARMPDEYEHAVASGDQARLRALNDELIRLDERMYAQQLVFLDAFHSVGERLNRLLMALTGLAFVLLSWGGLGASISISRRIRETEGRMRSLFREAALGIAWFDAAGNVREANERMCVILGRSEDELLDTPLQRMHGESWPPLAELYRELMEAPEATAQREYRFHRNEGTLVECRISAIPITPEKGKERAWMLLLDDLSETARLTDALDYQSTHDFLTGLLHRAEMRRVITQLLLRTRRNPGQHALVVMDLDRFRLVNETAGHAVGDEVLVQVGKLFAATVGPRHPAARLGGNQFAVLVENTTLAEAESLAGTLRRAIRETTFGADGQEVRLTASFGIAEISEGVIDAGTVMRCADIACDLAKEQGRNRIRVYAEQDAELAQHNEDIAWVGEIRAAITAERLYLDAQRIQPLESRDGAEFEVLVRLMDSEGRVHRPDAFIRVAERYDLVEEIDSEVLRKTLEALGSRKDRLDAIRHCHINVSAQSITSPEFRASIIGLARQHGVPFHKLCFELTETAAIANLQEARAFVDQMRGLGCSIALDDFGSGMSSFAYLKTLPVDILKIDGMFVRNSARDVVDQSVLSAFAYIGRALGKRTVAEWVEDDDVLDLLRLIGVDAAQGFAIERPRALEKWLEDLAEDVEPES